MSDILQELKASRNKNCSSANVIDGHTNSEDISEHFKSLYAKIYNTHKDKADLDQFLQQNNESIGQSDMYILEKITPDLVKKIISKFKNNKNDSTYDWKSDALKAGADSLADPLINYPWAYSPNIPTLFIGANSEEQ